MVAFEEWVAAERSAMPVLEMSSALWRMQSAISPSTAVKPSLRLRASMTDAMQPPTPSSARAKTSIGRIWGSPPFFVKS